MSSAARSTSSAAGKPASRGAPPDVPDLSGRIAKEYQQRPRSDGAARLRRGLGPGTAGAAPAFASSCTATGRRRYDAFTRAAKKFYPLREGEDEIDPDTDLKPKKKAEIPKLSRRPTLLLSPVSCPPSHLVLHPAGALHLGRLDQGTARLPVRPKSRSFRRFRRPQVISECRLGRHQLSRRRPLEQGLRRHLGQSRRPRPEGEEKAADPRA